MVRRPALLASLALLAILWSPAAVASAQQSFAAHMLIHIGVVALAAPLAARALAGTRFDPVEAAPPVFSPIVASVVEFLVVSAWHAPALHHAARGHGIVFAFEQATFLAAGVVLWLSALGGTSRGIPWRAPAGAVALLFTSMHMTLLGALFALAPRPLYPHVAGIHGLDALQDQQLGGAIMLLVGGASYLAGGLWLIGRTASVRGT